MMKTLNLNKPVKLLDGTSMQDETGDVLVGKVLANYLVNAQSDDPMKVFGWCQKLYAGDAIELDASDVNKFKSLVTGLKVSDLLKAQVLSELLQ